MIFYVGVIFATGYFSDKNFTNASKRSKILLETKRLTLLPGTGEIKSNLLQSQAELNLIKVSKTFLSNI